jgi:hypothetical protein
MRHDVCLLQAGEMADGAGVMRTLYRRLLFVFVFGVAIAYFEAAVVVYLRELFYPDGFSFPLTLIPTRLLVVELFREASTIIILFAVAGIASRRFWERFGYFIILFGLWDVFYYVWLKVTINWPLSILDWDVLFLIPIPWIGPVIAPILVSTLMIFCGVWIIRLFAQGYQFRATPLAWLLSIVATAAILCSFMIDTDATLHGQLPQPYWYGLLIVGLLFYIVAFVFSYRRTIAPVSD